MSLARLGKFSQSLFPQVLFQPHSFSFFLFYTHDTVLHFVPWRMRLCFFPHLFTLCCSDLVISIVPSSSSLILFSVPSILLLRPFAEYLFWLLYFSIVTFLLYIFCFFSETFFICLKHVCYCLLKHFYDGYFKILLG